MTEIPEHLRRRAHTARVLAQGGEVATDRDQEAMLPDEDRQLARIASMTVGEWRRARPVVQPFFHDGWKHKRIDIELAHAEQVSSKRRAAAEQRHSKSDAIAPPNAEQLDTHSHLLLERKKDSIPADAGSRSAVYAFESGVIRLKQKDFDQWKAAYSHLDLAAELTAMTEWAGTLELGRWFPAVSNNLAKKNREAHLRIEQAKNGPEFKWRSGIEGVV